MGLSRITPGDAAPHEVNVIIEIPAATGPVKYEVDKDTGAVFVDRFMGTAMFYPCNYGYVPETLADDGDPLDVLVVTPVPLIHGTVIRARVVGVLDMEDEAGGDAKILAVPGDRLSTQYRSVQTVRDLPPELLNAIEHFFAHYKDLEHGKWVKVEGWKDAVTARGIVERAIEAFDG